MKANRFALIASSLVLLAVPAAAQVRHDSSAPIDVQAGTLDVQDKSNRALLTGGVTVTQAELTIKANRVSVFYTGEVVNGSPSVSRMDASGDVRISQPDQSAQSQYAVYDLNKRIITLIGNVTLRQGANVLTGPRLVMNLDTQRTVIGGGAGGNGQIRARLSPPKPKGASPAADSTP